LIVAGLSVKTAASENRSKKRIAGPRWLD